MRDRDIGCVIALKVPLVDPRAILAQQKHNRRTGRRLGVFLPLLDFREFLGGWVLFLGFGQQMPSR